MSDFRSTAVFIGQTTQHIREKHNRIKGLGRVIISPDSEGFFFHAVQIEITFGIFAGISIGIPLPGLHGF